MLKCPNFAIARRYLLCHVTFRTIVAKSVLKKVQVGLRKIDTPVCKRTHVCGLSLDRQ